VDFDETEKEIFELQDDGLGFSGAGGDKKHLDAPALEVKELSELPEQWRELSCRGYVRSCQRISQQLLRGY
jgi:hypothetical protein